MSDLGAIFHVKKDGVQYDAHAYTTLDECPEPNLKLMYKGQHAYVKLEAKGSGDVPCYVKTKAGNTYQVHKEAIPTGGITIANNETKAITIPVGIKVVKLEASFNDMISGVSTTKYIGVTSGKEYSIQYLVSHTTRLGKRKSHLKIVSNANIIWYNYSRAGYYEFNGYVTISWSPKINKQTPTVTDY